MVWMYEQLLHLSPRFVPYVLCNEMQNSNQFKIDNLHLVNRNALFTKLKKRIACWLDMMPLDLYVERIAKNKGISLMHSHFGNMAWMNLRTASRLAVPHIASFYGFDVRFLPTRDPMWKKRYRKLFSEVDCVLPLGPNMASELESMGCDRRKIKVHHLGVDLTYLPFRPRQWDISKPLRVFIAGTFKEKKGIPYALEALDKIRKYVDLEITIIGDATNEKRDQIEKRRIFDAVHRLKLESTVKFLGYQPYSVFIKEAYNHHIFLAPSITANDGDTEGIPMTTVEMAASGMPIISTFHADITEIIQHGKTGWLVQERSVHELAACLHYLILNPDKWDPVLRAGRMHIEAEFDARKQGVRLGEIYKQVL
jgi:colanic acid/amylovoran biosynthesis glycosyltransferase